MQSTETDTVKKSGRRLPLATSTLAGLAACLLILTTLGWGQGVTGTLVGTVEDASHAGIPHAQVTVTNQNTGVVSKYTSDSSGNYTAVFLAPGTYRVDAVAPGFRNAVSTGNVVIVNGTTRVDMLMQVGAINQTVQVKAVAPLVQNTTSSMGDVLDTRAVESLPLNGRVVSQLVQTTPGAIATGAGNGAESASGVGAFGPITASVNGMPWQGTNVTIDGVSNMELENAFINVSPPVDAVQEVRVSTNNSSADVGVYGGAQVNEYMKSGTNQFHGSVFEYFRNDSLNARAWQSVTKAPFKGNQFGATFGGPSRKTSCFSLWIIKGTGFVTAAATTLRCPRLRCGTECSILRCSERSTIPRPGSRS
ncbi:MAG: carboxypeptidase regulatory-like domain-containing protein [Terriglobia bacterium]